MFANFNSSSFRRNLDVLSDFRLSIFLILCFVLGGTSQDIITPKLVLYLISLVTIGGCLSVLNRQSNLWHLKSMKIVLGLFFLMHVLYLIPLPSSIWSNLPGREFVAQGFQTLGVELPWLPLSLTPEKSFFALFDFLPPLALILMMGTVVKASEIEISIRAIGFFAIFSVILGVLQVANLSSDLYLYQITNDKSAVGFFSNANHFGAFLLMIIPLTLYVSSVSRESYDGSNKALAFSVVCILSALIGIGVSGSLGGFILVLPVLVASFFIWTSGKGRRSLYLLGILVPLIAAFIFDMFLWENLQLEALEKLQSTHTMDRQTMFLNTFEIAKTYFPFGTGPGSLADVYKLVEEASRKTIPHTHNEYIEMFAEFGVLGISWMILALLWVTKNIWAAFRSNEPTGNMGRYFSIPILVVLAHSMFDFSLRTISVMTLLVFCLCILVLSNQGVGISEDDN